MLLQARYHSLCPHYTTYRTSALIFGQLKFFSGWHFLICDQQYRFTRSAAQLTHNGHLHDAIIPDLNSIHANPTISQSVYHILVTLESGSRAEATQFKATLKKSGRFNATDTVTAVPEVRWPYEGFHEVSGHKHTLYDDLTVQEWALGQLSNICYIQDPVLVKQVLLQVILSLRDTTSLAGVITMGGRNAVGIKQAFYFSNCRGKCIKCLITVYCSKESM